MIYDGLGTKKTGTIYRQQEMCSSETQLMPPTAPLWNTISIYHLAGIEIISLKSLLLPLDFVFWPLTLKDDLDLSALKMCSSMRYTCMANIKLLSSLLQKLWPMLKFSDGWGGGGTVRNDQGIHRRLPRPVV